MVLATKVKMIVSCRCQAESKSKIELQQQLSEFHARCSHEIMIYQKVGLRNIRLKNGSVDH